MRVNNNNINNHNNNQVSFNRLLSTKCVDAFKSRANKKHAEALRALETSDAFKKFFEKNDVKAVFSGSYADYVRCIDEVTPAAATLTIYHRPVSKMSDTSILSEKIKSKNPIKNVFLATKNLFKKQDSVESQKSFEKFSIIKVGGHYLDDLVGDLRDTIAKMSYDDIASKAEVAIHSKKHRIPNKTKLIMVNGEIKL